MDLRNDDKNARNQHFISLNGQKECAAGGHFFIPKREWQKWCSVKCRNDFRNRQRYKRAKKAVDLAREILVLVGPRGGI